MDGMASHSRSAPKNPGALRSMYSRTSMLAARLLAPVDVPHSSCAGWLAPGRYTRCLPSSLPRRSFVAPRRSSVQAAPRPGARWPASPAGSVGHRDVLDQRGQSVAVKEVGGTDGDVLAHVVERGPD